MPARLTRASLATLIAAIALTAAAAAPAAQRGAPHRDISFHRWTTGADFARGTSNGTAATGDALTFAAATGSTSYADPGSGLPARTYDRATWTSPPYAPGFRLNALVASWNADTPAGTWVQIEMQGTTDAGATTKWFVMGRWASGDTHVRRTSVSGQGDANGTVAFDTFRPRSRISLRSYRLRVTLLRLPEVLVGPTVRALGAMTSALPRDTRVRPRARARARRVELAVPRYSQSVHRGHLPQFGGGGEAWCSPTATQMVVEYYDRRPADVSWVRPRPHDSPSVDFAARHTYDRNYRGTGNWPFNTAYAATYGLDAFVTRLRSLAEAERFVRAGIPLTVSVSFRSGELGGAGYSTKGHLMNIVGFTASGDVIANDPVARNNPGVRRVYDRGQFENVWIPASRSGGIAYVVHDDAHPLPANVPGRPANW